MSSPWLSVPLAEYEGHMKSAEVRQLDALSKLFAAALEHCRPGSVAVLGIAGGNGLEGLLDGHFQCVAAGAAAAFGLRMNRMKGGSRATTSAMM